MRLPLVVLTLCVPSAVGWAQGARLEATDGEPRIVVTSTRTTRLSPDRAVIYLLVEGTGETPPDAVQRATTKLQSVSNAVRQLTGIEGASAVPYGVAQAPSISGYPGAVSQPSFVARFALRVQLARLDQLTPLAAAALVAGASSASAPVFEASGADSVRRSRLADALANAKEDADVLAKSLGGRLGPLIEVSMSSTPNQAFQAPYISFPSRFESSGQSQAPEVLVTATVTVRYYFVPK